jgi:hypothetical protein
MTLAERQFECFEIHLAHFAGEKKIPASTRLEQARN